MVDRNEEIMALYAEVKRLKTENDELRLFKIKAVEEAKREADNLMINKILKYEDQNETFLQRWGFKDKGAFKSLFSGKFSKGLMKAPFRAAVGYLTTEHNTAKQDRVPIVIPFDIELDIDGTGGIYPGNSFHSSYVPQKYQHVSLFQAFDIGHRIDSSGWTTSITGKMRSTGRLILTPILRDDKLQELFDNYNTQTEVAVKKQAEADAKAIEEKAERYKEAKKQYQIDRSSRATSTSRAQG